MLNTPQTSNADMASLLASIGGTGGNTTNTSTSNPMNTDEMTKQLLSSLGVSGAPTLPITSFGNLQASTSRETTPLLGNNKPDTDKVQENSVASDNNVAESQPDNHDVKDIAEQS